MGYSPYYPDDVTDEMIDRYFGDDGSCCERCEYYEGGTCRVKEADAELDYTEEEIMEMSEAEYLALIGVDGDGYCNAFEWREEIPDFVEDGWKG